MRTVKRLVWYQRGLGQAGGGERLLLEGLKYFTEHDIEAVLYAEDKPIIEEALFNGKYHPAVLRTTAKNGSGLYKRYLLFRALRRFNPDIIIANGLFEAIKVWMLALLLVPKRVPSVCFIHGTFFQFADENRKYAWVFRKHFAAIREGDPVYRELISPRPPPLTVFARLRLEAGALLGFFAVRHTKAVFVLTEKAKREVDLLYGHRNVRVFHGAFSQDLFTATLKQNKKITLGVENKSVFFSLGRLVQKKRVDLLIRAFSVSLRKNPNMVLWVGGNGPERHNLEQLTEELGISDAVNFLGFVREEELNDYYLSCDLFVNADNADYDITSMVALALGKRAVVSSQHEFSRDLASLPLLFQAEPTPEGFTRAFAQALASRNECARSLREQVMAEYTWEHYFKNITDALNAALS